MPASYKTTLQYYKLNIDFDQIKISSLWRSLMLPFYSLTHFSPCHPPFRFVILGNSFRLVLLSIVSSFFIAEYCSVVWMSHRFCFFNTSSDKGYWFVSHFLLLLIKLLHTFVSKFPFERKFFLITILNMKSSSQCRLIPLYSFLWKLPLF